MAFFEIKDPNYNSDKIEAEIFAFLNYRKIPYEQERKNFEKYNLKSVRKNLCYHPLTPFKICFNHLPRWSLRIDFENRHPAFFMERWNEQIKQDLADIAIKNHVRDKLEPRPQLEYLLYDRFLLIKHIEDIEKEKIKILYFIEQFHKTLSWQITAPWRSVKKILNRFTRKDS